MPRSAHFTKKTISMPELPFQLERYIVKQLACDTTPEEIAEDVRAQFLREVTPEDVWAYHPDAEDPVLGPDLRDLFQVTRWEYEGALDQDTDGRRFIPVASTEVVENQSVHSVEKDGRSLAIVAIDDTYYALENRCTHEGGALGEGTVTDGNLECPLHGAQFDVQTGEAKTPPATEAVETFEVRVRNNTIEVKL